MSQSRRDFLKTFGLGTLAFAVPALFQGCAARRKPNIIFIMSDDHAGAAISCFGSKLIQTPGIDRIAEEGIKFENSFVTNSICAPSRAAMLTGKYSSMNGLRDNRDKFDGSQMTFPKLLQKAGYQTMIAGKWHLKTEPAGFDKWKILIGQGEYYNPRIIENGEQQNYTGYTTDLITDFAIDFMDEREEDKPFCLLVHHKAPHRNWMPNIKHLAEYKDTKLPLPETFYDDYKTRSETAGTADMRIDDMYLSFDFKLHKESYDEETGTGGNKNWAKNVEKTWQNTYKKFTDEQKMAWDKHYDQLNKEFKEAELSGKDLSEWKYQQYLKDYLRCIMSVDENTRRLLDYLDENKLSRDTIVIYTSDQGFYLGEHGWYDKRFMYEESFRMPLVMRYPREIDAGQVTEELVMNIDFAPTFLDYAGVQIPEEIQGESLRRLVSGGVQDWRKSVYYHYYEYPHGWHKVKKHYGVRTVRYKLIHFYDDDIWELYDLYSDPHELNNVYGDPAYKDITEQLKIELKKLQTKYKDTSFKM